MNVIQSTNDYPARFEVRYSGVMIAVTFDRDSKSFEIRYLNPNYNSHGTLHLGIDTIKDAEALRDVLIKAIAHAKAARGVESDGGKTK